MKKTPHNRDAGKNSAKRKFSELRQLILSKLSEGQKTINQLSSETGINWKTVDNHLTYLVGRGFAKEVFSSRFVRIFEATEKGLGHADGGKDGNKDGDKGSGRPGKSGAKFIQDGEVRIS